MLVAVQRCTNDNKCEKNGSENSVLILSRLRVGILRLPDKPEAEQINKREVKGG